jgi:exo-beta-1,3-glucanase (GH17 family)
MSIIFATTMGVNFCNTFQKKPISATTAISQIAGLGTGVVKTYNYTQTDVIKEAKKNLMQVVLGIPNDKLADLSANKAAALAAVVDVVKEYPDNILMICVGNEPLGSWWGGAYNDLLVPAMKNLNTALKTANVAKPLTVPFNFAIMGVSYPPSKGALNTTAGPIVTEACKVIKETGGVFMINIYPFLDRIGNRTDVALDYCLFTSTSVVVQDGSYGYKNIFDASYDALYVALTAIGYSDLRIVIGECGWPTGPKDTYPEATVANATIFNQNLIAHCQSGNGTPRVPNTNIPCFIFEMYDEDNKSTGPGAFETEWGVCKSDGTAKYTIAIN